MQTETLDYYRKKAFVSLVELKYKYLTQGTQLLLVFSTVRKKNRMRCLNFELLPKQKITSSLYTYCNSLDVMNLQSIKRLDVINNYQNLKI